MLSVPLCFNLFDCFHCAGISEVFTKDVPQQRRATILLVGFADLGKHRQNLRLVVTQLLANPEAFVQIIFGVTMSYGLVEHKTQPDKLSSTLQVSLPVCVETLSHLTRLGLFVNFHVERLVDGMDRIVNGFWRNREKKFETQRHRDHRERGGWE